jgi:hypothetical protein
MHIYTYIYIYIYIYILTGRRGQGETITIDYRGLECMNGMPMITVGYQIPIQVISDM